MDSLIDYAVGLILPRLGAFGIVLYVLLQAARYFKPEERKMIVEAARGTYDILKNIPRRWRSEIDRIEIKVAALQASGLDDEAAVKEAAIELRAVIRVIIGSLEDIANRIIDLGVVLIPFAVTISKAVRKRK